MLEEDINDLWGNGGAWLPDGLRARFKVKQVVDAYKALGGIYKVRESCQVC